jgi:hypothetical protein
VKFLLDTNVISEIRKRARAHPNVIRWVTRTPIEEIGTSVLVLAEIRHGIELKRRNDPEQATLSIDGSRGCGPGSSAIGGPAAIANRPAKPRRLHRSTERFNMVLRSMGAAAGEGPFPVAVR